MQPEIVVDIKCETGEGPLWNPVDERLYWVDIPKQEESTGKLYRYDPATDEYEKLYDGETIGGFTIQEDGSLVLLMERGAIRHWNDGEVTTILKEIPTEENQRFNDVIADPRGRIFGGTIPMTLDDIGTLLSRLYRIETDGTIERPLDRQVNIPNGMGFTPDGKKMYFTESNEQTIYKYDYNAETGDISNERVFTEVTAEGVLPDGMTVDEEGYVWSAQWNGGCLVRYAPDGKEVDRIKFPVKKVSSATFGGSNNSHLFVTTAGGHHRGEGAGPKAGALFRLDPGVKGREEFRSQIEV